VHGDKPVRRGFPALRPDRGRLAAVSLGRGPSLHGLRRGHRLVLGGVGPDLRAVERHVPELHQPGR